MIPHQTVGVHLPIGLLASLGQSLQEAPPVCVVPQDLLAPVPAIHQMVGVACTRWLAAISFLLHFFRLSIHRDATDQERGEDVVPVIVSKNEDSTSGGWNSDVVACRNPQLASVRQMDGERNKRRGMRKFPNISNHKE